MGWNVATLSYDGVSKLIRSQDSVPAGIFFKPDGTKMYMCGNSSDSVHQYSLSTAWDLSTLTFDSVSKSVTTENTNPRGIFFKPDGTKMYMMGNAAGARAVYQYSLSTAWDLSTASYDTVTLSVAAVTISASDLFIKPDGTKLYVPASNGIVYQYSLPTPWVLTGGSYDSVSVAVNLEQAQPQSAIFKSDGTKMYIIGNAFGNSAIHQYTLSTPWDLSTAVYDTGVTFSFASQDSLPGAAFFRPDGAKLYIIGETNDTVYQYSST